MNTHLQSNLQKNPVGKVLLKSTEQWNSIQGIQMRIPWSTDYQ